MIRSAFSSSLGHMDTLQPGLAFTNLEMHIGREIALTDWHRVPQEDASAFGRLTQDPDPMHLDPDWAREQSPYGQTVLAGFHLLSLLPFLTRGSGLNISGVKLATHELWLRAHPVSRVTCSRERRVPESGAASPGRPP